MVSQKRFLKPHNHISWMLRRLGSSKRIGFNYTSNNAELEGVVAKDAFTNQNCIGKGQGIERSADNREESIHSLSRTKTACLSQNGFSEEVVKISEHLSPLGDEPAHKLLEIEVIEPLGFEKNVFVNSSDAMAAEAIKCLGNDIHSLERSRVQIQQNKHELAQPPGFTTPRAANHEGMEKKKTINNKVESTTSTSESMLQLAQDSLNLGETLGLSVVKGKDVATRRITRSLKKLLQEQKQSNAN